MRWVKEGRVVGGVRFEEVALARREEREKGTKKRGKGREGEGEGEGGGGEVRRSK